MKKKILFVISRMAIGGSQRSLVNALNALDADRYDITLYVRENKTELIPEIKTPVRVVVNDNPSKYDHSFPALVYEALKRTALLFKFIKGASYCDDRSRRYVTRKRTSYEKRRYPELSEKYDAAISYLQGYTCKFTADVVKADRMICFFHNSTDGTPELHAGYLPKFDRIVTVANDTRELLASSYPEISDKLTVIQNIIDVEGIKRKARKFKIDRPDGKTMICTCGRISPEKGCDLAVKAAKILADSGVSFKWSFIGDGPKFDDIKKQTADLGLDEYIVLVGAKPNPYPWIAACDVYVQPSYEESQGLTIMEAQILGRPVVSTKTVGAEGNIAEGKTGLLVGFTGVEIAGGIKRLIDDPGLAAHFSRELMNNGYDEYNDRIKKQWKDLLEGKDEELR